MFAEVLRGEFAIDPLVFVPVGAMQLPVAAFAAHLTAAHEFLLVADITEVCFIQDVPFGGRGRVSRIELPLDLLSKPVVEGL
jgi:hypothetical protein